MTDRELLLENNAKLKTIQETLKNKILLVSGGVIEVDLPDSFKNTRQFFYKQINSDKLIISGDASTNVWLYYIKTKEWKQIYSGTYVATFQKVKEDKWLLVSGNKLLSYDSITDETKAIHSDQTKLIHLDGSKWVLCDSSSNGSSKMYIYDSDDDSINYIYPKGRGGWTQKVNDDEFLYYSPPSGVILINVKTNTAEPIFETSYALYIRGQINDRFICTSNYTGQGVVVINPATKTYDVVYENATVLDKGLGVFKDKLLIGGAGSNSSYKGFIAYDYTQNTATLFEENYYIFKYAQQISENKIILFASGRAVYYHPDSNSITQLNLDYTPSGLNNWMQITDTKWLATMFGNEGGSSAYGVFLFDSLDETMKRLYTQGYSWGSAIQKVSDDVWILTSSQTTGVLTFTLSTIKISNIYSHGKYNVIEKIDDNNYYLTNSNKPKDDRSAIYNSIDNKIYLDKVFIEVT